MFKDKIKSLIDKEQDEGQEKNKKKIENLIFLQ